jgi:hypothetical protein
MRDDQGENGSVETGIEETATSHAYASKGAAAAASVETDFDTPFVTATVNPASAPAPAAVETGFDELDETPADRSEPWEPEVNLDAYVADLLANKSTTDGSTISAFMAAVVPWPASPNDAGWVNMHWSYPDKSSKATPPPNVLRGGNPYKDITRFVKDVAWRLDRPDNCKDMFFCTSMQRDTKLDKNGRQRAAKSGPAAK